ncbi:MAG: SpoVR family protein [Bacteroidales bacterium]|nr:SpoVR family protein [Bacteroidales bacterium]
MKLIDQHTKKIMEECKIRAREAGLHFDNETLEYIVTNRDMIELSPKGMIPTMYDYWLNDVEVHKKKEIYNLYPSNPYETVINTRPAISFYNDNNPDWLNIMIFYHVLAHIDFFQNNIFFKETWNYDFAGKALADKRLINNLRSEHGRWVDYVIEFARSINNLTGYHKIISLYRNENKNGMSKIVDYYFNVFLQEIRKKHSNFIVSETKKYNEFLLQNPQIGETFFIAEVKKNYPEFDAKFKKYTEIQAKTKDYVDIIDYISDKSEFLNKDENQWMKQVIDVVRETAIYFEPQIRTKTLNEGWASFWHERLYMADKRIEGHESEFAKINAGVTSINRIGLNPYAIGMRLLKFIENHGNLGKFEYDFQKITNIEHRKNYDKKINSGLSAIFDVRRNFNDFTFVNTFVNQDFVEEYNLFVVGKRLNEKTGIIEYYIKSRKANDYKQMLIENQYHPPMISVNTEKTSDKNLYLIHHFEGKQLYKDFVPETMIGIEFLWGNQIQLETTEIVKQQKANNETKLVERKVIYTCKDKKVSKVQLES